MNNIESEKEKFMSKNKKNEIKDNSIKSILNNTNINNKKEIQKKPNLNKSVSFPSLGKNIILNETKINEYLSKKNYNFSNKNLSKSFNQSLLNNNNRKKIKNNILSKNYNRYETQSQIEKNCLI